MENIRTLGEVKNDIYDDLREMAFFFGGWDELRNIITILEQEDQEAAFERSQERKYEGDGNFAANH